MRNEIQFEFSREMYQTLSSRKAVPENVPGIGKFEAILPVVAHALDAHGASAPIRGRGPAVCPKGEAEGFLLRRRHAGKGFLKIPEDTATPLEYLVKSARDVVLHSLNFIDNR
jgi:hypothetical protein